MDYCCEECGKNTKGACSVYAETDWVERRGGCPIRTKLKVVEQVKVRIGQQKQKRRKK